MSHNTDKNLIKEIRYEVVRRTEITNAGAGGEEIDTVLMDTVEEVVFEKTRHMHLSVSEKKKLVETVFNSLRRFDILEPLLKDPEITEIMVNGPDNIFIEKNGISQKTDLRFETKEQLEDLIQRIVARVNRSVNEAQPIVDARLPDGSRVNVVLSPVALNGPLMTIRKFPEKPLTMEKLIEAGSISKEAAELLKILVQAKYNLFICGGTGSGKTTFLNVLSGFIPCHERIITIEDSAELRLSNIKNLAQMETRNANTEGVGEIPMKALIKTSLRMRPERIIVGEVRGEEALDMLQAMNTGHEGSMSTGHANSIRDMLSRLETMVLMAAPLPLEAIRKQIASSLDIMIFLSRFRDGTRKVTEISEVLGYFDGEVKLNSLYRFEEEGEDEKGKVLGQLKPTGNKLQNTAKIRQHIGNMPNHPLIDL
ncbi:putative conjugal transfer protein [Thermoclostridium stercorarium subsp. stercorarium DSM 8532]|uniref:Pilus assembly protein n=3 Tax=Thermoclostridium stercorarium TaxID=1510 RepID=A0A1B1YKE6_THEST|nr:CpaF family protein [Thermoclostridium stercorarium]AGC68363.1 putative conjugal transfer protein [Thermoclostridium stercorarium subsp. stercorarium DSM 8532]AGI39386.1 CpaF [Thermoclostridium stercorarium subsp. stercorarium DSM 8532]ANW98704.1 pilus assembly protein [Thermoclostridium stercorarium subsp. thermolacticum DSM 2910]ANX01245.1 pilus assembly protein [Thermoclostridium stercorarium subsp. leptospartum DSM 9219]